MPNLSNQKYDILNNELSERLKITKQRYESLINKPCSLIGKVSEQTQHICNEELKLVEAYEKQVVSWLSEELTQEENQKVALFSSKIIEWEITIKKILNVLFEKKQYNFMWDQ